MTNTTRLVAVNAGLSDPSSTRMLVDRLVEAATGMATSRGDRVDVEVIDLRDLAVDIGRSLAGGFPSGAVADAIRHVERADALIAATPVFNASYAGLFKSFFDLVDVDAMRDKPVLIAATGGSPRHSMVLDHALRQPPLLGGGTHSCTLSSIGLPYKTALAYTSAGNGSLTISKGASGINPGAKVDCGANVFRCQFQSPSITLDVTGGATATLHAVDEPLERAVYEGGICPSEATWDATYTVTAPAPLFIEQSP